MSASLAYWVIAFALGVFGGTIVYFALFADRARGRLRCPKCWYDMQGADPASPLRCPECGHDAKREKRLSKTRRRWRLAFVGLIVLIAGGVSAMQPKVQRDGWASIVPTTVLVFAPRFIESDELVGELFVRLSQPDVASSLHSIEAWINVDRVTLYALDTAEICVRNGSNAASHRRFTGLLAQGLQWQKLDSERRDSITQLFLSRLDHQDPNVRWDAIRALQYGYSPIAFIEFLKPFSLSADVRDRLIATECLDAMLWRGDDEAIDLALTLMQDSHPRVRLSAVRLLAIIGMRGFTQALPIQPRVITAVERLADDPDLEVRAARVMTIAALLEPESADAYIVDMIVSDRPADRAGTMGFIAQQVAINPRHLPYILRGLNDNHQLVRHWAAEAIKYASTDLLAPHRDAIAAAADHSDPIVATAARAALSRLPAQ